jgi:hypothetical protein
MMNVRNTSVQRIFNGHQPKIDGAISNGGEGIFECRGGNWLAMRQRLARRGMRKRSGLALEDDTARFLNERNFGHIA